MSNYKHQLQKIIVDYQKSGQPWPAATADIAKWAIQTRRYGLPEQAMEKICSRELAQSMREQYIVDAKGRRVRAKHPARFTSGEEQKTLWHDIRTAGRAFMEKAFQLRRNHIVGECRQAKTDVDSYNDSHPKEQPIQLVLDFTDDVAELEGTKVFDREEEVNREEYAGDLAQIT